ncbi:hypothetical protein F2Q69_00063611 [Brassica cretica]|uniref:Uncharacterized protein n=1 Tax=Brassica cretica TaxID=69181 RepID=A0A8S9RQJ8_BRACR|nr:hypothetical protein F2Q69_00063611 [Brassica cretica]
MLEDSADVSQNTPKRLISGETEPSRGVEIVQPPSPSSLHSEPSITVLGNQGHYRVRDAETSPDQEDQPESHRHAPSHAARSPARESHAPPSPPDIRRSHRSRPPSAAGKPPRLRCL